MTDMNETLILGTLHTRNKNIVTRVFQTALLQDITLTQVGDNIYHLQGFINPVSKNDPMFKRLEQAVKTIITEPAIIHFSNANYQWQQTYRPNKIKEKPELQVSEDLAYN